MTVQLGAQIPFDSTSGPDEEVSPEEPKPHHDDRETRDRQAGSKKIRFAAGQPVDRFANDQRNKDGGSVHDREGDESGENPPSIAPEPRSQPIHRSAIVTDLSQPQKENRSTTGFASALG